MSAALFMMATAAHAATYSTGFENFASGDVDGQNGWTSGFIGQGGATTALFDVKIVANTYGYASFGAQSLRISNATTSGAFGDQTFSASLVDEAGETDAATSTYSGGVRQPYFEAEWDFASAVPGAYQPGLAVVASADPGNGSRMSWLQMQDTPTGLQLNFEDFESAVSNFVETAIATNIDRTIPHTIKMTIQFVDGPSNDIVKIYLDGTLIHTGTTWEDYSRAVGSEPSPVDSIMFRVAGTAAPATAGKGFLIDNFSEYSGPVPATGPAHIASFSYSYTDSTGVSATGILTGTLIAPGEYAIASGTITLTGAPACTNCGGLSGPLNGTGVLVSPPPQPFQVGGGTELIGLDDLFFPDTNPELDTNGGLAFQMNSGLGIGIGGNGPDNYWIFGGNWTLNNNNGVFTASLARKATRFVFANVPSTAAAGSNATFNIEAVDASGTIDTTFEQGVTLTVGGSGSGGGTVVIVNGIGTSTVSDDVSQTVTLGLEDSQSTGLTVSSTGNITFTAGPVTQFVLNHPGGMNENTRLGYTLSREDQFGNLASAGTSTGYLYSNATSTNAAFFDAASGGNEITSTTIPNGSTSTAFWYYDDTLGIRTITVSDNPSAPNEIAGIADASDTFMVAPGAVRFIFANTPSSTPVGNGVMATVYAVDSLNDIYPLFTGVVTVTVSGSATGGGLISIVNGIGTTTITDTDAEAVTLGLRDTGNTGLGAGANMQIIFNAMPLVPSFPAAGIGPSSAGGGTLIAPTIALSFSGMAYPGASVMLIRKDLGLQTTPVTQAIPAAADGSFVISLDAVTRLTGQTYLLSFVDTNGLIAQTKAYNVPAVDKLIYGNILAAPTLGFGGTSVVAKNAPLAIMGYATPDATVKLFIDGNPAGTILVNDPSGKYTDALSTDGLALGRHAVWAIQTYATPAVEVSGYMNPASENELFVDDATNGTLLAKDTSGAYTFALAKTETEGGYRPVSVGPSYIKQAESDFSNQESFTVSPLADPKLDLNGDGVVNVNDLSIFLSYLKSLNADLVNFHILNPNLVKTLDFNSDGVVDMKDLTILETAVVQK